MKHSYQKIAFIFPGQGAQYPGMGKDFANHHAVAKETFEEANDLLHRDLTSIIFNGTPAELTETRNSQTGIYVMSIALLRVLEKLFPDLKPSFAAGLSLGEYTALTAAGKISFQDALPLVEKRATFMNEACLKVPGTMAVITGLNASDVIDIVEKVNLPNDLWAANFNCPGQVVISGTQKGIEKGAEAAKERGAKRVLPLQVQGAFHSGLMKYAEERLSPYLLSVPIKQSGAQVVMNCSGTIVEEEGAIRTSLIKQVTNPVYWEQGMRLLSDKGVDLFVEIGCGKTLSGMNKRIGVSGTTLSLEKIEDLEAF